MDNLELIKDLCKQHGTSLKRLEAELHFGNGYLAKHKKALPYDRLCSIAAYFGIEPEDLNINNTEKSEAYSKMQVLQHAFDDRPEMRTLFSLAENAPKEDIEWVIKKLQAMRGDD